MPALDPYVVFVQDMSATPPGSVPAGITPSWAFFKRLGTGEPIAPPPIRDVGDGQFEIDYDPEASGPARGRIDLGPALAWPSDRFINLVFYLSDSRTTANLDASVSSRATAEDVKVTVPPAAPSTLDPAATAALIGPLVQVPPPQVTVNPTAVTVGAAPVDVAALAADLGSRIAPPAAADLGPILAELAAIEKALADLPDGAAVAVLRRLTAARAAFGEVLTGVVVPGPNLGG